MVCWWMQMFVGRCQFFLVVVGACGWCVGGSGL